ncbi:MAG: glycosyltransferase, partial [Ruminococcus sp.]
SLFKYALDGITCFSVAPLRFTAVMGGVIFVISLIYILITLIQTLFFGITTPGYVTTLCAVLFLGGITEMSIGILGEYIGRIYMESKDRPIYITKYSNFEEENNEEKDSE